MPRMGTGCLVSVFTERSSMGIVINWPGRVRSYPAGRSTDSARREKSRRASAARAKSPGSTTQAEFARAGTTSQLVDVEGRDPGPSRPGNPKSVICPEALAFRELIMDDKSMQAWTNLQLTLPELPRKIRVVGRPGIPSTPATYRSAFFRRVRTARELFSEDYKAMAHALGIPEGTYYRYETRTMLPHHLVPRFCQLTGINADWLFNGPSAARALSSPRAATGTDPS
jgi:hypothetical protein